MKQTFFKIFYFFPKIRVDLKATLILLIVSLFTFYCIMLLVISVGHYVVLNASVQWGSTDLVSIWPSKYHEIFCTQTLNVNAAIIAFYWDCKFHIFEEADAVKQLIREFIIKGSQSDSLRFSNLLRFWYQKKACIFLITPWWIFQLKNVQFGRCYWKYD